MVGTPDYYSGVFFYIKHPLRYTITHLLYHKSIQLYSFIINNFYNNAGLKYKQLVLKKLAGG